MRRLLLLGLTTLLVIGAAPAVLAKSLHGVALVIGESDYDSDHLRDLGNPRNDARAMDELLGNLGFDVDRVLDKGHDKLEQSIADFVEEAKGADVALVYYSGHGIEAGGDDYLVPTDADISSAGKAGESLVPLRQLLDALARTVPVTIVLLDACRTDAFPPGTTIQLPGTDRTIDVATTGLGEVRGPVPVAQLDASQDGLGTVIGFAAAPGQAALDGDPGTNSPYAAALLKHLGAAGYSLDQLMTLVRQEVYLKTGGRQLPWVNSSLLGEVVFSGAQPDADPDEAAISDGRRKLLLSIATMPALERREVEAAAKSGDVSMDALYGLLAALGQRAPADPQALAELLQQQTERLRQIMAEQGAIESTDAEITRLSNLAQHALEEGALDANVQFREAAKARYLEISATLDQAEADIKARRLEGGEVLAKAAQAYELKGDFASAALNYGLAYEQVVGRDDERASTYRYWQASDASAVAARTGDLAGIRQVLSYLDEAEALLPPASMSAARGRIENIRGISLRALAEITGDPLQLEAAARAYEAALQDIDSATDAAMYAGVEQNVAVVLNLLGLRTNDVPTLRAAEQRYRQSLSRITTDSQPDFYANGLGNLGAVLDDIGRITKDQSVLSEAISTFDQALPINLQLGDQQGWAYNMVDKSNAQRDLANLTGDPATRQAALATVQSVLSTLCGRIIRLPGGLPKAIWALFCRTSASPRKAARCSIRRSLPIARPCSSGPTR